MNSRLVIMIVTTVGLLAGACGGTSEEPRQATGPMPTATEAAEAAVTTPVPAPAIPCPATLPGQASLPPEVQEAVARHQIFGSGGGGEHLLGSGPLWISALPPDGTLVLPLRDGALSEKLPWWRTNLGSLHIEGQRLDAPALPLRVWQQDTYAAGMLPNILTFPTEGCWEVVGRFDGRDFHGQPLPAAVRVVLRVVRGSADPRETLDRFMQARLAGDEQLASAWLADDPQAGRRGAAILGPLLPAHPARWDRYEVLALAFERSTAVAAEPRGPAMAFSGVVGRVRVCERGAAGTTGGGTAHTWEQTVRLVERRGGQIWLVEEVGTVEARRTEPTEPERGACDAGGPGAAAPMP